MADDKNKALTLNQGGGSTPINFNDIPTQKGGKIDEGSIPANKIDWSSGIPPRLLNLIQQIAAGAASGTSNRAGQVTSAKIAQLPLELGGPVSPMGFGSIAQDGDDIFASPSNHVHSFPDIPKNNYPPSTPIPSGATATPMILSPGTVIGNPIPVPAYTVPAGGTNVSVGTVFTPSNLFPSGFTVTDPAGYNIPGGTTITPTDPNNPAYTIPPPTKPTDGYGSYIYLPEGTILPNGITTPPASYYNPNRVRKYSWAECMG